MKRPSARIAAPPSPGTAAGSAAASQMLAPIVCAWAMTRPSDVWPIPRRGELTTRVNETTSKGLARIVR